MNVRAGTGWQTTLTDLSLILFMVTASVLQQTSDGPAPRARAQTPSDRSDPVAVWRPGPDAPPLAVWLAAQAGDPRQIVSILASYRGAGQAEAVRTASDLAGETQRAGRTARVLVEPGEGGVSVTLGYDQPALVQPGLAQPTLAQPTLARPLLKPVERSAQQGTH